MSIEQRAVAAGSDSAGVATANNRDFLLKCLKAASLDPELQSDVADACELHDFTALTLASGDLTVSSIESKLYLTGEEAQALLKVCERECVKIGVTFGRAIEPEPVSPPAEAANSKEGVLEGAVPPVSTGRTSAEHNTANLRSDVDTPTTPDLPEKNRDVSPGSQGPERQSSSKLASPKASSSPDQLPRGEKPTSGTPAVHKLSASTKSRPGSASVNHSKPPAESRRPLARSVSSSQPVSARKPPMRRTSSNRVDADNESQASGVSDGNTPSYLRPTATHKARSKKSEGLSDVDNRPSSAQSTPRGRTVPVPGFISSTLLRPTAAFLNRLQPSKEESGKWSPEPAPRLTQSVSGPIPSSSKGPRNTKVQPFHLSTDLRGGKDKLLSTDELQLMKAKDEMERQRKQVKSPRSRPSDASEGSESIKSFRASQQSNQNGKKPTQFKPFKLASLERHNKAQEELQRKIAEERQREEDEHTKFARKPSSRQMTPAHRLSSKNKAEEEPASASVVAN